MGETQDFVEGWNAARKQFLAMLADPEQLDEAEHLLKNWERWLRCEQLARTLTGEGGAPMTIDVRIEGL